MIDSTSFTDRRCYESRYVRLTGVFARSAKPRAPRKGFKSHRRRDTRPIENPEVRGVVEAARGKNKREREKAIASLSYFITFTRSLAAVHTEPRSRFVPRREWYRSARSSRARGRMDRALHNKKTE